MKIILFSIILCLYSILASDDSYIPDSILLSNKCNNSIEHCLECNPLVDPNFCSKCQDTYFWLPDTKSCIPCNDTTYGQIGCGACWSHGGALFERRHSVPANTKHPDYNPPRTFVTPPYLIPNEARSHSKKLSSS